jgi:methylglutaconyl-CoA hydratase
VRQKFKHITVTSHNHVAHVSLNRPPVNALNHDFVSELTECASTFASLNDISVVTVGSSLNVFCAGADLKERSALTNARILPVVKDIQKMVRRWLGVPQPVIFAINGAALGGGLEFALAADIIAASEDAILGFPEVTLGIIPAAGGSQLVTRRVSSGIAKKWIFSGKRFSARQAMDDGMVDYVFPSKKFSEFFKELTQSIASNAPLALRYAKKAINHRWSTDHRDGFRFESDCYAPLIHSHDRREALNAFLEKRTPRWKGK